MGVQPPGRLLLLRLLFEFVKWFFKWIVVVEFQQFRIFKRFGFIEWFIQRILQHAFELGTFLVAAILVATIIERGRTKQQPSAEFFDRVQLVGLKQRQWKQRLVFRLIVIGHLVEQRIDNFQRIIWRFEQQFEWFRRLWVRKQASQRRFLTQENL